MYDPLLGRPKPEGRIMELKTLKSTLLVCLIATAGLAGCLGGDEEETPNLDSADGGYEYASNVDNHRMLVEDVCDIKALAETHDWAAITAIYEDGAHAEKSDGSYRTLKSFADAAGKKHGLDTYYGTESPLDDYLVSALDGTGMFAGASDSVREQAVEKGVQNQIMTAYAIHELNAAIAKAQDGNWDVNSGAPHAWDEGWAFYHGLDEYKSCSPYATGDKRAGNFATANADGTAAANAAILQAMKDGKTALLAEDLAGATAARDDVVKNLVIIYSQATIRYASKMTTDSTVEKAQTHQAEGYSFWRVIESMVATNNAADARNNMCHNLALGTMSADNATTCSDYTFMENHTMADGDDICYNMVSHTTSTDDNASCGAYSYEVNYTMMDGNDICYNMVSHTVSSDNESSCGAYAYYDYETDNNSMEFTGCYNSMTHAADANMSQSECESFSYYLNYGATVFTGCYNTVTHSTDANMSQSECEAFSYYLNYGATVFTGCYNTMTHTTVAGQTECGYTFHENYGVDVINSLYNFDNTPVEGTLYEATVRSALQPTWTALGIDAATDIATLV